MIQKRVVFSRDILDDETLFVTLYHEEQVKQVGLLNIKNFVSEMNTTVYNNYRDYLKEMTNHILLSIDFLSDQRGIVFTYDHHQQIEYHHTYFSLHDPFFCYLFQHFIYKDRYQEKLKNLTKYKKSDTL